MERDGAAVTCDGRLFHRRAAVTGNALSPTVDRRVCRTSRDVDEAERIVVVWIQYLLVDVVHHTGTLAADHVDIFVRQKLRPLPYQAFASKFDAMFMKVLAQTCAK